MCIRIMNVIAYILTHFCINRASFLNVLVLQRRTLWINIFLDNILYCIKQIGANTKLPWRVWIFCQNWIKRLHWARVTAFLEQSRCFKHFNTRHAIYPQFSSVARHQCLKIKASMVTEPLHESWKAGSTANKLEILSKERIIESSHTQKFSHS